MADLTTAALFTQYLDVVNRAIGQHRDEFPYKQILAGGRKLLGDKHVGVGIYKERGDQPHDWFTIRMLDDGRLDIVEHGKASPDLTWKVREQHLHNVVDDPEPYIDHPAKLDLDWLRTRVS
ncbi:MAG: hypothetical protein ACQEXJ_11875 [Myxococcota bacterium]